MNEYVATPEMQDLSDQVGEFVYYWGFKRIHGKMWTHLFLAKNPLDAADFVKQMKISKALVSISLRELMEFEVIQTAGKSDRGTQLYKTNPDVMSVILSVLRQREKRMLSRVQAAQETMLKVSDADREQMGISSQNLTQLGELVSKATMALDSFIALKTVDFSDWGSVFNLASVGGSTPKPEDTTDFGSQSAV